jgi:tetratricopeptide (TPR) repeat protein
MKRYALLLIIFIVTLLVGLPVLGQDAAPAITCDADTDYASEAAAAFDAGDYEASLPLFYCATAADLEDVDSWARYALALVRTGNTYSAGIPERAVRILNPAGFGHLAAEAAADAEANPDDEAAALLDIWFNFNNSPDPNEMVDRLMTINPDSGYPHYLRGLIHLYLENDTDAARAEFETALELEPDNAQLLAEMASEYAFTIGDADTGLELISRAIELDPTLAKAYTDRGQIYAYLLGDNDAAQADFDQAVALDPTSFYGRNNRAAFFWSLGDHDSALQDYMFVTTRMPHNIRAVDGIVTIAIERGIGEQARLAFVRLADERIDGDELTADAPVTFDMTFRRMVQFPLTLSAGQTVTITAVAADLATLDPLMLVADPNRFAIAYNDDADPANGDWNASVTFTAEMDGEYTVYVTHAGGGSEGEMTVTVSEAE